MESEVQAYRAMWTTEKDEWFLWRSPDGSLLPTRRGDPPLALLIEDDDLAREVCNRMQEAGVEVQDESDEELLEQYRIAAGDHGRATESGDHRAANLAHDRLARAYRTLRARGPASQAKLLHLIRDRDAGVQAWVGAHALEFSPEAGERVLVELAAKPGIISFGAQMTLKEWRAGKLRFP